MKQNNYFNNLNSVLNNVKKELKLDEGLKQQEFIRLWSKIVGAKFQNSSKIAYIYSRNSEDVLMVAVSSSSVAQELSFFKEDILNKLKKTAKDFDYNITDIFFNPKLWEEIKNEKKNFSADENNQKLYKIEKIFTEKDLKAIKLPAEVVEKIKNSLDEQEFYSEELKQKLLETIIKDLKKQEWMKKNGFPVCAGCGIPISFYSPEEQNFCPICKFKEK